MQIERNMAYSVRSSVGHFAMKAAFAFITNDNYVYRNAVAAETAP